MPRFKDQAIVLREYEWSETSQVVVLLTREHGKVRGLAKGSKRHSPSSVQRFSGGIELLTRGEVIATTKRTTELATVTEWDQQEDYHHLRQDIKAQWLAMYAAELTAAMLADLDPHPAVFEGMSGFLESLRSAKPQLPGAVVGYQWGLLNDCGYRPELERDVRSGGELPRAKAYTFDPQAGGLTVEPSGVRGGDDLRVRSETVELLRRIAAGEALGETDEQAAERANRLLCVYARSILGRELNTAWVVMGRG